MGWFDSVVDTVSTVVDTVGSFFSSSGSSSSSHSGGYQSSAPASASVQVPTDTTKTINDPDRVKAAEIEQRTQLQLADKDNDKIGLMKAAKLELMTEEAQLQIALDKARMAGFEQMAGSLVKMQESLSLVAEKRLQIIEQGTLDIIRQTEEFYQKMQDDLSANCEEFASSKLPALLDTLQKYEAGSAPHNLYFKQIDALITNQNNMLTQQMSALAGRQQSVIDGVIASKKQIMTHTDQMTAQLVQQASAQAGLSSSSPAPLVSSPAMIENTGALE